MTTLKIYNKAIQIYESDLSWEAKYDLIFSKEISQQTNFVWFDPDTTYEADVTAYINAFIDYMSY